MFLDYVLKFHLQDCIDILIERDILGYYYLKIDFLKLFETYPEVGDKVLCKSIKSLPECNTDILKAQQNILEKDCYKEIISKYDFLRLKRNVHARFFGLPVCPELHRTIFPKNLDLGCFLKVLGTVVRVTQTKMLEYQRKYVCMKCKYENVVEADFEHRYVLKAPSKCGNQENKCKCSTFTQINMVSREYCKDYQEIKIQEQVNKLSVGTIPGSMWVVIEDDLVDHCNPGDDVNICGTVRRRWRPLVQNKKSEVELVLQANYIEVCNAQRSQVVEAAPDIKDHFDDFWNKFQSCPLKGRDRILAAVCPQVFGLHVVKLAVLLTVITGSNHIVEKEAEKKRKDNEVSKVRGQCHLLLVGDPGTSKSQLLRAGAALCTRSVFTSGAGSTRAGLTCSALREDGEWQLEAGALVLSDGGVCAIDELSLLRTHDRAAIHEATEQQTISVAKAGIVCKLNTRCAILAACNPKGHYDTDQPLAANVSLGTPLLSRFDLIFILLDTKHKVWDKQVSSYILFGDSETSNTKLWSQEKLQTYISLVGPRYTEMTKSANIILQSYYMAQRQSNHRDTSRTTVRMLDSLVRLSHAHCRLMYRKTILPMDAIIAVSLVDLSMQDCTLSDTVDALHSNFVKYPDFDYLCTAKKLLTKLNLCQIWQEELLYYAKLLQVDSHTLNNDIDNRNLCSFAKFDNVTDDNLPLSATEVTSSYFNNNKVRKVDLGCDNVDTNAVCNKNSKGDEVTEKLAKTLKKFSELNKKERVIPIQQNNRKKRKRKEVTIDTSSITRKIKKLKKGIKMKNKKNSKFENDDTQNTFDMLQDVPSVNDVFKELGIDFNIVQSDKEDKSKNIVESKPTIRESNHDKKNLDSSNSFTETSTAIIEERVNGSRLASKLKKFKFKEKSNENQLKEDNSDKVNMPANLEIKSASKEVSYITKISSVSSSQLSIFESSDCDIDLDI